MDESYGTDVDEEYVDDHDYDDADDDTDDDNDHKKDSYVYVYIYCCWCCSHQDQATSGGYIRSRFIPNSSHSPERITFANRTRSKIEHSPSGQHVGTRPSRGCS